MTEEQQNQNKSTRKRRSYCPTICFIILTGLNALSSFVHHSEGTFRECLHLFLLTETGPFSWIIFEDDYWVGIIGVIILGLYISSTFIYRSRILGFVATIAVILWFLLSLGIMLRCLV